MLKKDLPKGKPEKLKNDPLYELFVKPYGPTSAKNRREVKKILKGLK
ncbi:hypothetical protein AGMMS49543_20800 [Betaproteobacteria bacterium]|nr:hypothetical protein AGMMS49543_20800 [Betaproteobacteria bacterium]